MKKMLDERELQAEAKGARWGMWTAYLVLVLSALVKTFLLERPWRDCWAETAAILLSALVNLLVVGREGVFDPRIRFNAKNCMLLSLIPALAVALFNMAGTAMRYPEYTRRSGLWVLLCVGAVAFLFTYCISLAAFAMYGFYAKYRERKLNREMEEEDRP